MIETKIYVGLNDADTLKQKFDTSKYVSVLKSVCKGYGIPFSFTVGQGGYFHEDGRYTDEVSIILSLIDADKSAVNEIAKDLCIFFNQESVMITENKVEAFFISDNE